VLYDTAVTDAGGAYSFTLTEGGVYKVSETMQTGWFATNPQSGYHQFTAVSGQDQNLDFLNFKYGSISGLKFYDANHNGALDSGEAKLEGWEIQLFKNGALVATDYTDANGQYSFTDLGPGQYTVKEVIPSNPGANLVWAQTMPGGDGEWDIAGTSGMSVTANFGNIIEFTAGLTQGYWKTHTGYDSPPRDAAYDQLPNNPMSVDEETPDGNYQIDNDEEAKWLFDGAGSKKEPSCKGDCRSLFRNQLMALHMNMLKYSDMGDMTYMNPGDAYNGMTVQQIYDEAISWLTDGNRHNFTSFQNTLDAINNNGHSSTGSHVLVDPTP